MPGLLRPSVASRVLIPGGILSRKPKHQDVRPSVVIEIVGELEEYVGVCIARTQRTLETLEGLFRAVRTPALESLSRGEDLVPHLELRTLIPEGSRNDVFVTI